MYCLWYPPGDCAEPEPMMTVAAAVDSGRSSALWGLWIIGRDPFEVYPLTGEVLNIHWWTWMCVTREFKISG